MFVMSASQAYGFGSGLNVCSSPVQPVILSNPVVIQNCTQAGIQTALDVGGHISFNCGSAALTIPIDSQLELNPNVDTVLDGGGLITLDGQGKTRILHKGPHNPNTVGTVRVTLQNLRFINGKAPAKSANDEGWGGAVNVGYYKTRLYVIDSTFSNNETTSITESDNQGGAVYTHHCHETIISGSEFVGNQAGNGGGIGGIASGLFIFNSRFLNNKAIDTSTGGIVRGHGGAVHLDGVTNIHNPDPNRRVHVCGSTFEGNTAVRGGGALKITVSDNKGTTATYEKSTFIGNTVSGSSGVEGLGGAIYHIEDEGVAGSNDPGVEMEVLESVFRDNQSRLQAGAVWSSVRGESNVIDSTFINNRTTGGSSDTDIAGALRLDSLASKISGSTFSENQAWRSGGAVWLSINGTAEIVNSSFSQNRVNHPSAGMGGALTVVKGHINILNTSFVRNYAWFHGGGIQTGNEPVVSLTNTLFYYNESKRDWGNYQMNIAADIDGGGNLQFPAERFNQANTPSDGLVAPTVLVADPRISPLAENGGVTQTMALLADSAAIDSGVNTSCPAIDQRGVQRNDGACDIGAYEFAAGGTAFNFTHGRTGTVIDKNKTSIWHPIAFFGNFGGAPVFVADLQTNWGGEPAELRMQNLTGTGVEIKIEEDKSVDNENNHLAEDAGYLAVAPGVLYNSAGEAIGEAGSVQAKTSADSDWAPLTFLRSYTKPVVRMQIATFGGAAPVHVRLRNVNAGGLEFQLEEWDHDDQFHGWETINYVVVEAGDHVLPNNNRLVADTVNISADGSGLFTKVLFSPVFAATPVVLSQSQTYNDPAAIVTRQKDILANRVKIRLVEEEAADQIHGSETVGYLAIGTPDAGAGTSPDGPPDTGPDEPLIPTVIPDIPPTVTSVPEPSTFGLLALGALALAAVRRKFHKK